jgi:hypothetical protein
MDHAAVVLKRAASFLSSPLLSLSTRKLQFSRSSSGQFKIICSNPTKTRTGFKGVSFGVYSFSTHATQFASTEMGNQESFIV